MIALALLTGVVVGQAVVAVPAAAAPEEEAAPTYLSMSGSSGALRTPSPFTVGHLHGKLGVWESFGDEALDQAYLALGLSDYVEFGLQSDIPSRPNPRLSFWFKVNGLPQDHFFPWQPAVAFGIHREGTFINAGWRRRYVSWTLGVNFSDTRKGPFAHLAVHPLRYVALQVEYDQSAKTFGFALRGSYWKVQASVGYLLVLNEEPLWTAGHAFWGLNVGL